MAHHTRHARRHYGGCLLLLVSSCCACYLSLVSSALGQCGGPVITQPCEVRVNWSVSVTYTCDKEWRASFYNDADYTMPIAQDTFVPSGPPQGPLPETHVFSGTFSQFYADPASLACSALRGHGWLVLEYRGRGVTSANWEWYDQLWMEDFCSASGACCPPEANVVTWDPSINMDASSDCALPTPTPSPTATPGPSGTPHDGGEGPFPSPTEIPSPLPTPNQTSTPGTADALGIIGIPGAVQFNEPGLDRGKLDELQSEMDRTTDGIRDGVGDGEGGMNNLASDVSCWQSASFGSVSVIPMPLNMISSAYPSSIPVPQWSSLIRAVILFVLVCMWYMVALRSAFALKP